MQEFEASDGTRLCYRAFGPANGVPVVLCHGLAAGGEQFAADGAYFAGLGYRVLVPNLRGHGSSGVPRSAGPDAYSPKRLGQDLFEMLNHAQAGPVHWVGNSLGGIVALHMMRDHPTRFRSLALFGTALALDLPAWSSQILALLERFPGRRAAARITAITTTHDRAARPLIEQLLLRFDARAAAGIVAHIHRYDLTEAALEWTGPGLVLVGRRDRAINTALLRQLPKLVNTGNWRIVRLAEGGHCANLDDTAAWRAALLDFWSV